MGKRGEDMVETLFELDMHVFNNGNIPTFDVRGGNRLTSFVDVTACSEDLLDKTYDWRVMEKMTSSGHNNVIMFLIKLQKSKGKETEWTTRKYNTKNVNWPQFLMIKIENNINKVVIEKINDTTELDSIINIYNKIIIDTIINDRKINLRYAGKEVTKKTNKKCVQGSIGGPILWNLLLDPLLKSLSRILPCICT